MKRFLAVTGIAALVAGAAHAQDVNGLVGAIARELAPDCRAGSQLTFDQRSLTRNADGSVAINLGGFNCQWEFTNHPYCGMRSCAERTYRPSGGSWVMTGEALR